MRALALIGYPLFVVAAMNFSLGAYLFLDGGRREPLRPYASALALWNALYCLAVGTAYVRASHGLDYDAYYRAAWVGWLGLAPIIQMILTLRGEPERARRWGIGLYVVWGTILVLCLTTDLVEAGVWSLRPYHDRLGPVENLATALGGMILCAAFYLMWDVRRSQRGRKRQQTAYFLLGTAVYVLAGLLLVGVLPLLGHVAFDPGLVAYFSLFWVALCCYAIKRHRLFDFRFVLSRGLDAIVLSGLLVAVQLATFHYTAHALGARGAVIAGSALSAVLFFLTPLARLVARACRWLFARDPVDYDAALKACGSYLATAMHSEEVIRPLLDAAAQAVGTISGAIYLAGDRGLELQRAFGGVRPRPQLDGDGPLCRWLERERKIFIREEQEMVIAPEEMARIEDELHELGAEAALPLHYQGTLAGVLLLGPKRDRDAFVQRDVDLLETIAAETAIALANARLVEELEEAVHVRDDFLSIAGHELRTPLTALQLNVQSLLRAHAADADRAKLTATQRQVARLERLTNELLDVSRITAHRLLLEREPLDLCGLTREVSNRFAEELRRTGAVLQLRGPGKIEGFWDRVRIEQIVTNLISNAIKYGGGKPITVEVERRDGRARVTVRDRGIGIEPRDQARIFDRFERAVAAHQYGGIGLGLWITKQVVEAHGGTIAVESERGRGSTFVVELPLDGGAS